MPRFSSVHPIPIHLNGQSRALLAGAHGSGNPLMPIVVVVQRLAGGMAAASMALALAFSPLAPAQAASALLESVKQNPQLAKQLCADFKQLNAAGRSATSAESLARVASSQGLSTMDAEVLTTYVIGLYCPDVR
jgi:hypothetical protein